MGDIRLPAPPTAEEQAFLQIAAPIAASLLGQRDAQGVVRDARSVDSEMHQTAETAVKMAWYLVDAIRLSGGLTPP